MTDQKQIKRRRLEKDFDTYTTEGIAYFANGTLSERAAKILHDRALTCVDLANAYISNNQYSNALIYVKSAINDIKEALLILKKLKSVCTDKYSKNYKNLLILCNKHVKSIDEMQEESDDNTSHISETSHSSSEITSTPPRKRHRSALLNETISPDTKSITRSKRHLLFADKNDSDTYSETQESKFGTKSNISGSLSFN